MIGAIVGDIIGSRFERAPTKNKRFKLYTKDNTFTDDSIMTIATLDAIIRKQTFSHTYRKWGKLYPDKGYGSSFNEWIQNPNMKAYNSWGNGSAMRVSPIAYIYDTEEKVLEQSKKSAECTHNHAEGIRGAQAIALAIYLARNNYSKQEIKGVLKNKFKYNLDRETKNFKRKYQFDVSCQGSVPEAIICFLESNDFEDAIRRAIALGGDSDTLAAMAGSIAEAYYGYIPRYMMVNTFKKLPDEMWQMLMYYGRKYNVKSIINYKLGI